MNPAEVAQSALPLTSSDLSIFGLFWSAHIIVKAVMLGLLIASIWVWAIAIDKTVLYARTRQRITPQVAEHSRLAVGAKLRFKRLGEGVPIKPGGSGPELGIVIYPLLD